MDNTKLLQRDLRRCMICRRLFAHIMIKTSGKGSLQIISLLKIEHEKASKSQGRMIDPIIGFKIDAL